MKGERWRRCRRCGQTSIVHKRKDLGHRFESDDRGVSRRPQQRRRKPTADEILARPGTVLRRYGR